MIFLKNIYKDFDANSQKINAVNDVSMHIKKGDIYGIIGSSGAGKSTLVRCINLLETPTSGIVIVNNEELTSLKERDLRNSRKNIGMIFQHFNILPSRTVYENVAYPLRKSKLSKKEIKQRVNELLRLVNIQEKENAYPSQLSGGQKQRVAIARALANNPSVLLCDEATSALDPQTTHSILHLLRDLNNTLGITIVIITHEMSVIKEICHKVAIMDEGKVIESGNVYNIFASPKEQVTKDFINISSNLSKIYGLIEQKSPIVDLEQNERIILLKYSQKSVSESIISEISRKFNINFNIIFSDIEIIQQATLGGVIAIISGEQNQIEESLIYLKEKNVGVEVIKDGSTTKLAS